jgi:hypothetical protein
MKSRKFIYLSDIPFDGTVYRTQVIDWLELYKKNEVVFNLYKIFQIREVFNFRFILNQIKSIRNNTCLYKGFLIFFPSKGLFVFLNSLIVYLCFGKEIELVKKISRAKIIYIFDARGAGAEEIKYRAKKQNDFSINKLKTIAHVYYMEYRTLLTAEKVFTVSYALQEYFRDTYNLGNKKYVLYPCLSNSDKFFYNSDVRNKLRKSLKINDKTRVIIYSGGLDREWHITEKMFALINQLFKAERNSLLICLTKYPSAFEKILDHFSELKSHFMSFSVPNNEVYKYLNGADYGILFREDTIMNNVASPTKFAEYMLCGLPVLITEGVGDYSDFASKNKVGILLRTAILQNPEKFDFNGFLRSDFDRTYIADIGRRQFSKNSIIDNLVEEFKF